MIRTIISIFLMLVCASPALAIDKLLQSTDFTYLGAFRPPYEDGNAKSFGYGGGALSYYSAHNSLFINDIYGVSLAEIQIPNQSTWKTAIDATTLQTTTILQNFTDPRDGGSQGVGTSNGICSSTSIGGSLVYNGQLIGASYAFYDSSGCAATSHFTSGLTLSTTGDFGGFYTVGTYNPGFVGGPMAMVPASWQTALGGPVLTGQSTIPIITRTSLGPSASVFNPSRLGLDNPVAATMLVGYPSAHQTFQAYDHSPSITSQYTSPADRIGGIIFPEGSKTVLFIGRHGTGDWCYGQGTATLADDWQTIDGENNCYDPDDTTKGEHSYPYVNQVWAYSADDFAAVKAGTKNPWELVPYAMWTLSFPIDRGHDGLKMGVAYDAANQIMYLVQAHAYGMDNWPIIHAYSINLTGSSDTTAPVITAFSMPSTATSTTVSVTTFTATDAVGVTGYCITRVNNSSGCSWSGSAPSTATGSAGANTWYAWARDAAGNVSVSSASSTTITISGVNSISAAMAANWR